MSAHTPACVIGDRGGIYVNGELIAVTITGADPSRIVACVNACAGIPDPTKLRALMDEADDNAAHHQRIAELAVTESGQLRAQRDALAEALAPFAEIAELFDDDRRGGNMPTSGPICTWPRMDKEYALTVEHLRAARAALAKLEGKPWPTSST